LKLQPIRRYLDALEAETGRPTASAVGIRAEESARRAAMDELSYEPLRPRRRGRLVDASSLTAKTAPSASSTDGAWVWRPLMTWSVEDVLRIHNRHGVPVNPLYRSGADRVGCWPCIFSGKNELRLIAQRDPERIAAIAELEEELTAVRRARNEDRPGRYATERASYFQGRRGGVLGVAPPIRDVVTWARTARGGRQLPLFEAGPRGGCLRWGLCDATEEPSDEG
jgi:3'-phosphoadenosine 5'-phosphosulfate sulfotransferase (PAPS reductase)/FAD synthetase